ncbi:hypothetical protein [Hoeflea ulvae]|uniref:Uncharacterized protein n=1 Tax=Hoeflea ulvae TaxID=2983764 RepID=A0ABT3YDF9_9HYPH|nr:hypothetical protein [Hoeflea ulvae]MCY0093926.1 hypothetical protein [Hoeflea ulvae]
MKNIIPPYGVILRDAIATGDKDLMQAFIKYSDFLKSMDLKVSDRDRTQWEDAHAALVKAAS